MSRYVQVAATALTDLDEVARALASMGLPLQRSERGPIMLEGSFECPGEPVDLRLPAGTLDAIEDFGFVRTAEGPLKLVCGELDRTLLVDRLLAPLRTTITESRVRTAAARAGLELESTTATEGQRRLVLRRRGPFG
jgi:hypothetical protein